MQGNGRGLHHALAEPRAEHPGVVVHLRRAAVADIRQALREGTVDLAVVELTDIAQGVCIMPKSIADRFPDLPQYRIDRHAPSWKCGLGRHNAERHAAEAKNAVGPLPVHAQSSRPCRGLLPFENHSII
ncbi:hypothetical protein ACWDAG_27130 [Streptomyces sp. NPDC001157]